MSSISWRGIHFQLEHCPDKGWGTSLIAAIPSIVNPLQNHGSGELFNIKGEGSQWLHPTPNHTPFDASQLSY